MTDDILHRILGPAEPEIGCVECFEELDRYVEAEIAGGDADAAVPVLFSRVSRTVLETVRCQREQRPVA